MRILALMLVCAAIAGCAAQPVATAPSVFNDKLFTPPSTRIDPSTVFAVSPAMRRYLDVEIADQLRAKGKQQGLFDALYSKDQLKLEYDSAVTRTAAQAFDARAGNCLSLTIMTAALARELGMSVRFQRVFTDENWTRAGGMYFASGHVNLTLGRKDIDPRVRLDEVHLMTVDFFPVGQFQVQHTWAIEEKTILAMFMNNRAAESLADGKINDAYWWAREGVALDPAFLNTYNTLGVIYRRHGDLAEAEQALKFALEREPGNAQVMSNLVLVLQDRGRTVEAAALTKRLDALEPNPPYHFFNLGRIAMQAGDFKSARDHFAKEVAREPTNAEFQFWLALSLIGLGDHKEAQVHLSAAVDNSSTRRDHDIYAAKLAHIQEARAH